jgi:hypothetical protein
LQLLAENPDLVALADAAFELIDAIHRAADRAELVEHENRCQDLLKAFITAAGAGFDDRLHIRAPCDPGELAVTSTTVQHNGGTVADEFCLAWKRALMPLCVVNTGDERLAMRHGRVASVARHVGDLRRRPAKCTRQLTLARLEPREALVVPSR